VRHLEVLDRLGGATQRDRGPGERELCLAELNLVRAGHRPRPGRELEGGQDVAPDEAGGPVLLGQQGRELVLTAGRGELQRLGQPTVQQPAAGRADRLVGGVPQQVVGEAVAAAQLPDDPLAPQLVDRPGDGVGVQVTGLGEQFEGEVATERCGEPGGLLGRCGGLRDPAPQDRSEPLP
jgi:hypothetical protein